MCLDTTNPLEVCIAPVLAVIHMCLTNSHITNSIHWYTLQILTLLAYNYISKPTHFHSHLWFQNNPTSIQNWSNKVSYQSACPDCCKDTHISCTCSQPVIAKPTSPLTHPAVTVQCHCRQLIDVSPISQFPTTQLHCMFHTLIADILSHCRFL